MKTDKNFSIDDFEYDQELGSQIDLKLIYETLLRNKFLIAKISFLSLLVFSIVAVGTKRIWKGEFQIVVDGNPGVTAGNQQIKSILGFNSSQNNELNTEVQILQSPSVLMDLFEFVKNEYKLKNNNSLQNIKFRNWKREKLDVSLQDGTTILNISYRDSDKKIILPALNKLSNIYQDYALNKRLRDLELGDKYFVEQISIYKQKSLESLRKAQQYAIDQDIAVLRNSEIDKEIVNSINIETMRLKAATELRILNEYIEIVNKLASDSDEILYLASTIPNSVSDFLKSAYVEKINEVNSQLSILRGIYKENDITIQDKLLEKKYFLKILKKEIIGILNAKKSDAITRINASERPKGVLIRYKQLLSEASKDKITLNSLENDHRTLLLEKARSQEPWELITEPTLLPNPVAPKRKRIAFLGLLGGLLGGSFFAFFKDKREDIIFSMREAKSISEIKFIEEIFIQNPSYLLESIELLFSGSFFELNGKVTFFSIGKIEQNKLNLLEDKFNELGKNIEICITNNFVEAMKSTNLFLIAEFKNTKRKEIKNLVKKIRLQKRKILGLLVINNDIFEN